MADNHIASGNAVELDRLATQLAKDPHSKVFMPLAEEYGKAGMWQEAAAVLEDGLKLYPGFITAMVALGRAYDQLGQLTKAKAILEESVKLSPENLRAHRTLIKIYQSQGLIDSALQSCAVILAANPHDEEALSIRSALGGPLKQPTEEARPRASAGVSPDSGEGTASDKEVSIAPHLPVLTSSGPETPKEDISAPELDLQAVDRTETPPPSPHADVVAQLEAWLRAIESRRHDRATSNESGPNTP